MTDERVKRGPGRPRKTEKPVERTRRRRKRQDGEGPLHIANPDKDYKYAWVLDTSEAGPNCLKYINRDYEFVTTDDGLQIGSSFEYESKSDGSIYRVPAGKADSRYLFLMKIPKEWYNEDFAEEQRKIDARERNMLKPDKADGQYGHSEITRGPLGY